MHGMYVFWWVYFFVVGAVAKLLGGVMRVSRSNTNPISIEPPRNFLYDSNIVGGQTVPLGLFRCVEDYHPLTCDHSL